MKKTVKGIFFLMMAFILAFAMLIPSYAVNGDEAEIKAEALKSLGLFKGVSDMDFDLDRAPTRIEALIMLIRTMGKESEVFHGSWIHPFSDVPSWADNYVGYGYEKGLTKGVSSTEFGNTNAGSDMYITFMLRALGYKDSEGDFKWDDPENFASSVGLLPDGLDTTNFTRADAALISWEALEASIKGENQTLSQKLLEMDIFNSDEYISSNLFVDENGGTIVSTFDQLQAAIEDKNIRVIQINSDIKISGELFVDREDGPDTLIYIKSGTIFEVNGEFTTVGCYIINDGRMIINGVFDRGLCTLTNNGTINVKSGGEFSSGMTETYNRGEVNVDVDGKLLIERGTQFYNYENIVNNGYILVDNGGNIFNDVGKIENNGIMDLNSYFSGEIESITGIGTVNDNR